MSIFSKIYANYYDLFYKSKDYREESEYILKLSNKFNINPKKILDLGCGTGKHIIEWAKKGIEVKGIDQSKEMLNIANESISKLNNEVKNLIKFEENNILNFDYREKYNLITCMFAVLGYIVDTNNLIDIFKKISNSLSKNDLFICDTWHGNAVLSEKPSNRIHEINNNNGKIFRIAKSELDTINQIVNIDYSIIEILNSNTNIHQEKHSMRYFFPQEMKLFAEISNMELIYYSPFLLDKRLDNNDWNIVWVFRKN